MNSRMEKYNFSTTTASRSDRNQKLYNQIDDIDVDYIDLNDETEIDLFGGSRSKVGTRSDYHKRRELESIIGKEDTISPVLEEEKEEIKSYDIHELLQKARSESNPQDDNKKRFINTEYNILTKLDLDHLEEEKEEMKKENLRGLIDTIYSNTLPVDLKKEINKPIMADMMATVEINEEISKKILNDDSTTKVIEKKRIIEEEKTSESEKNDQLRDLINQTLIGSVSQQEEQKKTDKQEEKEEKTVAVETTMTDSFGLIDKKEKKFTILIVILSVLAVLAVGGVILAKYLGVF